MGVFIIGYGTLFEYFCYDLDDLVENFREYPVEGLENVTEFRFRKPEQPETDFSVDEIEGLVNLLSKYPTVQETTEVIENIRNGLRQVREMTQYDKQISITFNNLPERDKPLIREWLYQLFYLGMYMRRWKGPGNPYPTQRKDTQGPDPNVKVNEELTTLGYYPLAKGQKTGYGGITTQLSKLGQKFVDELRSIEYIRGDEGIREPRQETKTIGYYLSRVRKGNMCIRMASSIFTGTSFYYLKVFYSEVIPGFDPRDVDRIV
jgi:hypothetical protein